jgi:hypothetical protein
VLSHVRDSTIVRASERYHGAMASPSAALTRPPRWRRFASAGAIFSAVVVALLWFGWNFPTYRFISPEHGLGYALGIVGGSMMLLLLLYPLRKRIRWLRFLGSTSLWFRTHMVLGVLGPLLVLYHANFSFGATNSNVAMVCMLVVSASGLFGRYFYAQIHHGLYGGRASLQELRAASQRLHGQNSATQLVPGLMDRLASAEEKLIAIGGWPGLNLLSPLLLAVSGRFARWRLHRFARTQIAAAVSGSPTLVPHQRRLLEVAFAYIDRRLHAARRVGTFETYERLFSLWHILHLPLFFMLLIAGIVHVIAVHVY